MSTTEGPWEEILDSVDRLGLAQKLELIERVARSLRAEATKIEPPSPAQRRANLMRLLSELDKLPAGSPADGFSNRDHDQVLYGNQS
jgi:hypothetical protein